MFYNNMDAKRNYFIALVPMKGHSERVKNKNRREIGGKPLFWYILNTLTHCRNIGKICVDTDDTLIEEEVLKYFSNVEIINRPENLRGDFVSMNDIIEYDISVTDGEYYLQTHSTNPLLKPETIDRAIDLFIENSMESDSLFSVNRMQTRLYDKNGNPLNHDPDKLIRTQDLDPIYEENSNIYIFTRKGFADTGKRIGRKPLMYEMNPLEAVDIDDENDFLLAQALLGNRQEETV